MQLLIKILKDLYCVFDNNELHKERTFISALRSPAGFYDDYYYIDNKDLLKITPDEDIKTMFLCYNGCKDENRQYYDINFDYCFQVCKN